jgi:hypothetical protein
MHRLGKSQMIMMTSMTIKLCPELHLTSKRRAGDVNEDHTDCALGTFGMERACEKRVIKMRQDVSESGREEQRGQTVDYC